MLRAPPNAFALRLSGLAIGLSWISWQFEGAQPQPHRTWRQSSLIRVPRRQSKVFPRLRSMMEPFEGREMVPRSRAAGPSGLSPYTISSVCLQANMRRYTSFRAHLRQTCPGVVTTVVRYHHQAHIHLLSAGGLGAR